MAEPESNKQSFLGSERAAERVTTGSVLSLFEAVLKVGGFVYVIGFFVILLQTARLRVPGIEVPYFQAVIAGLPRAIIVVPAFLLSEHLRTRLQGGEKGSARQPAALLALTAIGLFAEVESILREI